MTYGLNFPSVPLPYFYQANKMLSGQQHHLHSNTPSIPSPPFSAPRDEDLDNNCSDEQSVAMSSSPRETQAMNRARRDSDKRLTRPHEEDVEVD